MSVEDVQVGVEAAAQELSRCGLTQEAQILRGCEPLSESSIRATRAALVGMRPRHYGARQAVSMVIGSIDRFLDQSARAVA